MHFSASQSVTSYSISRKKTQGMCAPVIFKKKHLALAISAMFGATVLPAFAGPEGGVVTGGSGTIDQSGNTTVINQTMDLLAIDWNSFDVGVDE